MAIAKRLEGVVSRSTIYKTVKDCKDTGKTERKPSTWKASVRTAPFRKRVRENISQDLRRSMRRDGQGQGRLEDHNVEVMPGGPGNDSLQKTAPASPIGGHQGQAFGARTSNPENLVRWHDAADLVDG